MIRSRSTLALGLAATFALLALDTGCRSSQTSESGQVGGGGSTQSASSTKSDSSSPTVDEESTSSEAEPGDSPDEDQTPESKTPSPEASPQEPQDIGAQCREDRHCVSGHCAKVRIESGGGIVTVSRCSECKNDSDCSGQGARCVSSAVKQAKICSAGELGRQCDDDNDCADPTLCAPLLTGENSFETKYCSECRTGDDCKDPAAPNCLTLFGGKELFNSCEADGVRKDGDLCFPCDTGDLECQNFCVKAEVPNDDTFCIGVCGACRDDSDCAESERCAPPEFKFKEGGGFGEHVPSKCVAK